jgi:hypothetical protein
LPYQYTPVKPLQNWLNQRTLPKWKGGDFRKWLSSRKTDQQSSDEQ